MLFIFFSLKNFPITLKQGLTEQPAATKVLVLTVSTLIAADTWLVSLLASYLRTQKQVGRTYCLTERCIPSNSASASKLPAASPLQRTVESYSVFRSLSECVKTEMEMERRSSPAGLLGRRFPSIYIQCRVNPSFGWLSVFKPRHQGLLAANISQ